MSFCGLKINKQTGFSLLEIILAVAIFSGTAISVGYLIIDASKTTDVNSKKIGALLSAKEGIEAVRSIRNNEGFTALSVGDKGLLFDDVANTWSFSGTSDTSTDGVYTRVINISNEDEHTKEVTSTVTASSSGRDVSVSLTTQFTNWQVE